MQLRSVSSDWVTPGLKRVTPTMRLEQELDRLSDQSWYIAQIKRHDIRSVYQKRVLAILAHKEAAGMELIFDVSSFCEDKNVKNALVWMRDRANLFVQIPDTTTVKYIGEE